MSWRIIELQDIDIATLHAVEDVLLRDSGANNALVFSKLKQPGISLGSSQSYSLDIDVNACEADSVVITRRLSGGRSMYLDDNYIILSMIDKDHQPLDLRRQYQKNLSRVLHAMKQLTGKEYTIEHQNDICVEGKKIGGAAQKSTPTASMVHCYIRVNDDIAHFLKYVRINGHDLSSYYPELRPKLACARDFIDTTDFYTSFRNVLLSDLEHYPQKLTPQEEHLIEEQIRATYSNMVHIRGSPNYTSRGNCDLIEGSGPGARIKIASLEGKIKFS